MIVGRLRTSSSDSCVADGKLTCHNCVTLNIHAGVVQ